MSRPLVAPEVDVCLVGLGATGALAADVLTAAGRRVLALEAGPPRTGREFTMDELRSSGFLNAYGAEKFNTEVPTWRPNANSPTRAAPSYWRMANGTGGSSLVYGAVSYRFHPDDFQAYSATIDRYGPASLPAGSAVADWPLGYNELEPYYDRAERILGVAGLAGNLRGEIQPGGNPFEGSRRNPYPLPPLRSSGLGEFFADAARARGYHPYPVPAAINSVPYGDRAECTYCSYCTNHACHVGAKGSVLDAVLPRVLSSGLLEVRTGCRVLRLALDQAGEVVGVEYRGPDGPVLQPAGLVLLASYTFENVRLLLLTRDRHHPRGLGNGYGRVGRYFMARQYPAVYGVLAGRRLNRFTGPFAQAQTIDDLNADNFDHTDVGFIRGGRVAAVNGFPPILSSAQLPPHAPRWGSGYKAFLAQNLNSVICVAVNAETLPYTANYLDLDPDACDISGAPLVRITFDIYDNETRALTFLQDRAVELLEDVGATSIWRSPLFTGAISAHDIGGTRMGTDPSNSVVDGYGRLHESSRVYVLGGSVLPTQAGLNPTLTLQALALRTAHHIVSDSHPATL